MDSLTQIAIGIATVEVIAGRTLKNRSFLYGAILGTLPDLDVWLGRFFAYEMELAFHRSFTHSFFGWIILSPLLAWLIRFWNKELSFHKWTWIVFCTLLTHTGIDLFTAWGVQLLYPLTDRFSLSSIAVVDPLYTLPWVIGLILLFRSRDFIQRRRIVYWTTLVTSLYLAWGLFAQHWVYRQATHFNLKEVHYEEIVVKPTMGNSLLWSIHVQCKDHYLIGHYSLLYPRAIEWKRYCFDPQIHQKWMQFASVQTLGAVSEGWYIIEETDSHSAIFNDLRFGVLERDAEQEQFVFSYRLTEETGNVWVSPMPKNLQDGRQALQKIWQRMTKK